ncbi:hypothetical protein MUB24_14155 [Lederbergia sp. NSJ-179]|uniref:hypothetical protein n=1 Tax=Lederbergia sp. NSJ-179 TaxID=2931402 RepID=UPI001FD37561|nr:hypothetical protein [Lederbergia sp. NSJ-179]MCJ7842024.1 hypothetical protein [Lederbergia sp. NSJ-179]
MGIKFTKREEWFSFYDGKGEQMDRKTEIRFDPLTGETSRIIFDAGLTLTPPDYSEAATNTGGKNCPFCPENILNMTPVFSKNIAEEGRIIAGDAICFPNLFPYSKHNGVVVFSDQHYVRLAEFTSEMITNAFMAAQIYIQNVVKSDPKAKYASINWNYLPYSGGSILHPHLHVIVSESATNYQQRLNDDTEAFQEKTGSEYFEELCKQEKVAGERWIGEKGKIAWMHAFAPKGHNDFLAIFQKTESILDIKKEDWNHFAKGLQVVFKVMEEQGFASFNLLMQLPIDSQRKQPPHVRLIPRFTIGGLDTSDINYFQALHQEPLSYKYPEDIAAKAQGYFNQ